MADSLFRYNQNCRFVPIFLSKPTTTGVSLLQFYFSPLRRILCLPRAMCNLFHWGYAISASRFSQKLN